MISDIRKQMQTPAFKSVIAVALAGFVLSLVIPLFYRQSFKSTPWILRVNGSEVDTIEFRHELGQQKNQITFFKRQYGQFADMLFGSGPIEEIASQYALNQLIRQKLFVSAAQKMGIQVHSDTVSELMRDPRFVWKELGTLVPLELFDRNTGTINLGLLKMYLKSSGLSETFFDEKIEQLVAERELRSIIDSGFYIPSFMVNRAYIRDYAPRSFTLYSIPVARIEEQYKKMQPTTEQLSSYFEKNKQRYTIPEKRSGVLWSFDPQQYGIAVSNEQINTYYNGHKSEFVQKPVHVTIRDILVAVPENSDREQLKNKARDIQKRVTENPSQFASIAQEVSDDKKSAEQGGLKTPFSRNDTTLDKALIRASFLLEQDGAVSDVVQAADGFHIVQRVSKSQPEYKSLDQVKSEIVTLLTRQQFADLFKKDADKALKESSVDAFAKQKKATQKIVGLTAQDNEQADALFAVHPEAKIQYMIRDNKGIITELSEVVASRQPSLDEVKDAVVNDWRAEKVKTRLSELTTQLRKALQAKQDVQELKATIPFEHKETGTIDPQNQQQVNALQDGELPVGRIMQLSIPGAVFSTVTPTRGIVVQVKSIKEPQGKDMQQKESDIKGKISQELMPTWQEGFIASLYRNAKIETNDQYMHQFQD